MRGNTAGSGSVDALVRALLDELPELDPALVRPAIERAVAKVARAALDTEGPRLVDQRLARVEATEDRTERARILRELANSLAESGDAERALVVRRAAFAEAPAAVDVDVLLQLGRITQRMGELPLDEITELADITYDGSPARLNELAAAWHDRGLGAGDASPAVVALERLAMRLDEPARRAPVLVHAAEVARLYDYDKAQALYERARGADPDLVSAIDGLATLLRDRGGLAQVIAVLVDAAERPALSAEQSRWLADAGDLCVATGDTERAKRLYRAARTADPANHKAGLALIELCWDTGDLADLAPMLDELCRTTVEPGRLRGYLLQRGKLANELGDAATAREVLTRAVELDPHDPATRRELADLRFDAGDWLGARTLIEGLLDDREDLLQPEVSVELHYRVARCAQQLGDTEGAAKHAAVTLALSPLHRPALLLRAELEVANPDARLADQLALANLAPADEKGPRFSELGDRYAELGDRATAREMYREALAHRPADHLLLTKFLGLVADQGDWSYSLDLVQRLIDTEQDPKVRARYRHLAAMIFRDELSRKDQARALFAQAIDDDPQLFTAADELEALVGEAGDHEAMVGFYYLRLEHVRHEEGRRGERLRLWDRLAELCLVLGRREDAVTAFEVAVALEPDHLRRRQRLADLYLEADPKHAAAAIAQHHAVLRANKRRIESYEALRVLYRRTGQPERARACEAALAIIGMHVVDDASTARPAEPATGASVPLSNDDWIALGSEGVDQQLSALFALVAPVFIAERTRGRSSPQPLREQAVPAELAQVLNRVADRFGVACPPAHVDPDQTTGCALVLRPQGGVLAPVVVFGPPSPGDELDHTELAFVIARQLADLRNDRFARLLCPGAPELAQIIDLAMAQGEGVSTASARWLEATLRVADHDRVLAIAGRLRERRIDPARAALDWLAATERAADRIGLAITGDLAACVRVLERERSDVAREVNRIVELVWSSVTEDVLAVRARIERWPTSPHPTAAPPA